MKEREREKREGIVRDPGEPKADMPSDRPEDDIPHPDDVTDFHGDATRDRKASTNEVGPTGSTPR